RLAKPREHAMSAWFIGLFGRLLMTSLPGCSRPLLAHGSLPVEATRDAAASVPSRSLAVVAILLAALIVGGGTGILAKTAGTPLGAAIVRGASAAGVVVGLAYLHLHAPALFCVVNAMTGMLSGIASVVLYRLDGKDWPGSVILGGACFGGAVGVAFALESLAGAL